jgi:hypothetical protein
MRGGSAPEVSLVTFERSTDSGQNWMMLGRGTRIAGGWELTGLALPGDAAIRARGRTGDGSSTGIVEQVINVPEVAVEFPAGTNLTDERSTVDYGPTPGSGGTRIFTLRNPGTVTLTNLAVSVAPGENAGDFAVTQPAAVTLNGGEVTTFAVTFTPSAPGARTGTIEVSSNDPDENPFEIAVSGRVATASEAWRLTHFGYPENTGDAAETADPDGDGLINLMEFATASDPLAATPSVGELVKNGDTLEFTYTRPVAALTEVSYVREFSGFPAGAWFNLDGSAVTILNDDGVTQTVRHSTPAGTGGKRFVRLRVTRL